MAEVLGGHAHGGVDANAVEYLRIAAVGMPALFVALAGNGHLTGLANTRRPLVIALVSNVVNVALEVILVYGLHLGIAGSAWGTVIMAVREGLQFESAIESDSAPVYEIVLALLKAGIDIHCLRDLTRGGLASALNEIAEAARVRIEIVEKSVPVREDVHAAC